MSVSASAPTTLLTPHLERISSSLLEIASYPFPESRIFTNALLKSTDIVTFIRDTESHERALFIPASSSDKPITTSSNPTTSSSAAHAANPDSAPGARQHRNPTVYSVLGGDMVGRIRRGFVGSGRGGEVEGVDVDLLLLGAEKLTAVYEIPQAANRIARARMRYDQLTESIANYSALVESQRTQLNLLNRLDADESFDEMDVDMDEGGTGEGEEEGDEGLDEMIREQEEMIGELEQRIEILEHRIAVASARGGGLK